MKTAQRTLVSRKHSTAAAETNLDTFLLIFSLQVRHITGENKYKGLLFTGNFMCTFWSRFPVLTATVTKQDNGQTLGVKPIQMFYIGRHFLPRKAAVTGQPFLVKVHLLPSVLLFFNLGTCS